MNPYPNDLLIYQRQKTPGATVIINSVLVSNHKMIFLMKSS